MKGFIKAVIFKLIQYLINIYEEQANYLLKKQFQLNDVSIGRGFLEGNVKIGKYTYINNGYRIVTGANSKIYIGEYCAIGRNFMCASRTHDKSLPTADKFNKLHSQKESDIYIGNSVWIGDNVIIKEGIRVENDAIIGANSVVTKNVNSFEIVGGVPAIHLAYNTDHYRYQFDEKHLN